MGVPAPLPYRSLPPEQGPVVFLLPGFLRDLVQCSAHGVGWKSSTQDACRRSVETSMQGRLSSKHYRYQATLLARFPSPWERPWLDFPASPILSLVCSVFCLCFHVAWSLMIR